MIEEPNIKRFINLFGGKEVTREEIIAYYVKESESQKKDSMSPEEK